MFLSYLFTAMVVLYSVRNKREKAAAFIK